MATSRAHTAPALHSLPDLIPSAGKWTSTSRPPITGGRHWQTESQGLTARRTATANNFLAQENPAATPGRMNVTRGGGIHRSEKLRLAYGAPLAKTAVHDDFLRQKISTRPRVGPSSFTGPSSKPTGSDLRPMTVGGVVPKDEEVYRMCDSTCVPGVGWGELLARDRYCEKMGLESFAVKNGRITFQPFEPAPEKPPRTLNHPMGKEAAFFDMLRGGGKKGKTAMRHAKEWDNNPVTRPGLIEKKLKGNEMRQSMYRTARDERRSWTSDLTRGVGQTRGQRPRSSADVVLGDVEERMRGARDVEDWRQQYLLVTGGSWDLSQQLSISLKGGIAKDAVDMEEKGAGADVWVPPKEGEHMRALREYMAKEADDLRRENEMRLLRAKAAGHKGAGGGSRVGVPSPAGGFEPNPKP